MRFCSPPTSTPTHPPPPAPPSLGPTLGHLPPISKHAPGRAPSLCPLSAELCPGARLQVVLDRRYHNRELEMMKGLDHDCVIRLHHHFEKPGRKRDETYLHLVMDFLPETIRSAALQCVDGPASWLGAAS